ncbi:hypothetical protein D9M72_593780 [compost metagenome]
MLLDDGATRLDTPGADAERLDGLELLRRHRQKGLEAAQGAVLARVRALGRCGGNGIVLEFHAAL